MSNTMPARDFAEAGLVPEGIYRFDVAKSEIQKFAAKRDNPDKGIKKGQEFKKLVVFLELLEELDGKYTPKGRNERLPDSFPLYGKSLRRLAGIYKAVTGTTPTIVTDEETGEEVIDFDAICDALTGGKAWGVVTHRARQAETSPGVYEDTDEIDAKFGWSFSDTPEGVKVPKIVQKRWEEEATKEAEGGVEELSI